MTKSVKSAQRKANEKYEAKVKRKIVILRPKDSLLIEAIETSGEKFNPLVRKLLSRHYNLNYVE